MMRMRGLFIAALILGCVGCAPKPAPDTTAQDQADIQALEAKFAAAFNAKDVNSIMALYTPGDNLIVFDAAPPRQYNGWAAYQKDWQDFFASFPGPTDFTLTELSVTVGGNVAYSHSIQHGILTERDGKKFDITVRVTDGYQKVNGVWLIAHEHVSVPVDLNTLRPVLNSQ